MLRTVGFCIAMPQPCEFTSTGLPARPFASRLPYLLDVPGPRYRDTSRCTFVAAQGLDDVSRWSFVGG